MPPAEKAMLRLRSYCPEDAPSLLDLFRQTVRRVNCRDYTAEQIDAWSSDSIDPGVWAARFQGHYAYVAEIDGRLAGFSDMAGDGYLDRLFVSAAHQRQGVGKALLAAVIDDARAAGMEKIFTDASITARPFFEACGFTDAAQQVVHCRGVAFINYRLTLRLASASRAT